MMVREWGRGARLQHAPSPAAGLGGERACCSVCTHVRSKSHKKITKQHANPFLVYAKQLQTHFKAICKKICKTDACIFEAICKKCMHFLCNFEAFCKSSIELVPLKD